MAYTYTELSRADGLRTAQSSEDGTGRCVYQMSGLPVTDPPTPPLETDIDAFSSFLCGGVYNLEPASSSSSTPEGGKIQRACPLLHPYSPGLTVSGVSNIAGVGTQVEGNSVLVDVLPSITNQFSHFNQYEYTVEFKRRPYFVLPDESIQQIPSTYYKPDGTSQSILAVNEWNRYTTLTLAPTPDTVNATTGGQMKFRSTLGAPIDGSQFPGQVWVYMQNQILEMNWFLVPYRYFFTFQGFNPYLTRFVNTVNQNAMFGYNPGTLLFLGATPTPFLPLLPNIVTNIDSSFTQSQTQLCNVKLRWLATSRSSEDAPSQGSLGNMNDIPAGHNLQPSFVDRQFHYVTTEGPAPGTDMTKWHAAFPSFPHELFFTDPMLVQPGGEI